MFSIETENVKLHLEVVRVASLMEHEEILPHLVDKLILDFQNWADLHNPIIVDQDHIVLDGNHRTHVFKQMNFKYIPVCKIDYFSEAVGLRYWYRLVGNVDNLDIFGKFIKEMGGTLAPVPDKNALILDMERNFFDFGVQYGDFYGVIRFGTERVRDAVSAYYILEKIQEKLLQMGKNLKYIPCQSMNETAICDTLCQTDLIIYTPQITKEMVVDAAKKKKVFAPKTTRHLIAARPRLAGTPHRNRRPRVFLRCPQSSSC